MVLDFQLLHLSHPGWRDCARGICKGWKGNGVGLAEGGGDPFGLREESSPEGK